nr:hypothetical protein [Tanacetum cinerariifolium]
MMEQNRDLEYATSDDDLVNRNQDSFRSRVLNNQDQEKVMIKTPRMPLEKTQEFESNSAFIAYWAGP